MWILPLLFTTVNGSADEFRLLQHLKENYDYFERPVENSSRPLEVKVRFMLNQIIDVDEKNKVVTLLAYIDYHWHDYKLQWNPKDYGGITDLRYSGSPDAEVKLWRPDVLLFNSVAQAFDSTYSSKFIVYYNGEVQQNPPGIFRFSCNIDITWFPFDDQVCYLKFGSWTYNGRAIDLDMYLDNITSVTGEKIVVKPVRKNSEDESFYVPECIDLQVYVVNGEWDLLNTPGMRVVSEFNGEVYHELYYYIRIRRRTLAYGINLIIPSLVISVMTVLGFTLPPDTGEKLSLESTVLLSVIFFLQMTSNMTPPDSKAIPILAAFFSCCLLVVSASCVFTVLILSFHHRKSETHEMGPFIRKLFLEFLPYILCMRRPSHPRAPKPKVLQKMLPVRKYGQNVPMFVPLQAVNIEEEREKEKRKQEQIYRNAPKTLTLRRNLTSAIDKLHSITADLTKMGDKIKETYKTEQVESEWRFAAMAMDRLCLLLFSVFITVVTLIIITPHIVSSIEYN